MNEYYYYYSFSLPGEVIDLVDYTKLCGFQTIKKLAEDNKIDSVYIRYVNDNQDMMIDCNKPTHVLHFKDIIALRLLLSCHLKSLSSFPFIKLKLIESATIHLWFIFLKFN